jgi:hypothetical protein
VTAWDLRRGINVLWRVELRQFGCATPVIVGHRLFTVSEPRTLVCMDKMTGTILWLNDGLSAEPVRDPVRLAAIVGLPAPPAAPAEGDQPQATPARWSERKLSYGQNAGISIPTPVSDGTHVWVKNGGWAACFDLDGNRQWVTETHLQATDHPMNAPSPVLAGGVLVCEGGFTPYWNENSRNKVPEGTLPANIPGKTSSYKFKHWMVGLDARTGRLLWDVGPLHAGGYGGAASPIAVPAAAGGPAEPLVLTAEGHLIAAADGKLIIPYIGARAAYASPYLVDNRAVFTDCFTLWLTDPAVLAPDPARPRILWSKHCAKAMGGSVYRDGLIYIGSLEGRGWRTPMLSIYDAGTGEQVWRERLPMTIPPDTPDYPSPASAGRYVFLFTGKTAAAIEPGRRPWLLAASEFERMHAGPLFDGERLYLRTLDAIMCFARTGEAGARYERQVQARTLLAQFPTRLDPRTTQDIPPPADFKPGGGVEPFQLKDAATPDRWLVAGPFPAAGSDDPLQALGGCAAARPARGTKVTFGGAAQAFRPLDRKFISPDGLDVAGPAGGQRGTQCFYYAVLEVAAPVTLVCEIDRPEVRAWLGGRPVETEQALRLGAGLYPLLLKAVLPGDAGPHGPLQVKVAFGESPPPDEEVRRNRAFIHRQEAILRRIIELVPGSPEAARAADLLARARGKV